MNRLTDEILNRYIDGELSTDELSEVKEILRTSEDAKRRLYAMQLVHNELKRVQEKTPSPDFTTVLMRKIIRRPQQKGQRFFVFSVSTLFVAVSLAIIGYLTSYILSTGSSAEEGNNSVDNLVYLVERLVHGIKELFTAGNVSIIGFIFSFAIIISAYFFFDSHKHAKARLTKL